MEVDEAMGGAMQKGVKCDLEMLKLCTPVLRMCDEIFSKWYIDRGAQKNIQTLSPTPVQVHRTSRGRFYPQTKETSGMPIRAVHQIKQ